MPGTAQRFAGGGGRNGKAVGVRLRLLLLLLLLLLPLLVLAPEAGPAARRVLAKVNEGVVVGARVGGLEGHEVLGRLREGLLALGGVERDEVGGQGTPFEDVAKVD